MLFVNTYFNSKNIDFKAVLKSSNIGCYNYQLSM